MQREATMLAKGLKSQRTCAVSDDCVCVDRVGYASNFSVGNAEQHDLVRRNSAFPLAPTQRSPNRNTAVGERRGERASEAPGADDRDAIQRNRRCVRHWQFETIDGVMPRYK
jgi:hypothetical protein